MDIGFRATLLFTILAVPLLAGDPLVEKPATYSLFVNGGAGPESNFSIHEEDLQAFYYTLFHGKAEVLNAKGKESPVVPIGDDGLILRDSLGLWRTTSSQFKGPSRPANLQEVRKTFGEFKRNPRPEITAVFGDHGTEEGISLWGDEPLSPRELHSLHARLPPQTLVRSIHLHCNANAAVLDPARKRPTAIEDWPNYLNENYRKNSCALATSGEDEVSDYLDFGKKWGDGTWNKLLTERSNPSLQSLRDSLVEVKALRGTVRLTSDNLAEDVFNFFCGQTGYGAVMPAQSLAQSHNKADGKADGKARREDGDTKGCFSESEKNELARLDAAVAKSHLLFIQTNALLQAMGRRWIENEHPEMHQAHNAAQKATEEGLRDEALGKLSEPERTEAKEFIQVRAKQIIDKYKLILAQIGMGDLNAVGFHEESLRPEFKKWLAEDKEVKEHLSAIVALFKDPQFKKKGILDVLQEANESYDKARGERKKYYGRMQGRRRAFAEALLQGRASEPEIGSIRDFYESIKRCETSPIR